MICGVWSGVMVACGHTFLYLTPGLRYQRRYGVPSFPPVLVSMWSCGVKAAEFQALLLWCEPRVTSARYMQDCVESYKYLKSEEG